MWRWVVALSALGATPVWAGEVRLTLPDSQLRWAVEQVCVWHHCESETNGGYKPDAEKAQWVANNLVRIISGGRLTGLSAIGATMELRFDQETP